VIIRGAAGLADFNQSRMGKVPLASGQYLYAGLNCFLPGQEHKAHVHPDQDKLYVVLDGAGVATVGGHVEAVSEGDVIFAPAGVPHGMRNDSPAPLTVLTVFAPPPSAAPRDPAASK
jgi:quercetin dioxygenase-like cupin family protein